MLMPVLPEFIWLVLAGLGAGLAGGMFGIGGGVITVPSILYLTGASFRQAVGASLLAIALTTPLALWPHHGAGHVRWPSGLLLGLGGLAGVAAAALVDPYLTDGWLYRLFAAFLVWSAHRIAYGAAPLVRSRGPLLLLALGFGAGAIAKLLGVGGGLLMVPGLVFSGADLHAAVATSLLAVLTNAGASTALNFVRLPGPAWIAWGGAVAIGSAVGMYVGARAALRTRAEALARGFALLLLLVALSVVVRSPG